MTDEDAEHYTMNIGTRLKQIGRDTGTLSDTLTSTHLLPSKFMPKCL